MAVGIHNDYGYEKDHFLHTDCTTGGTPCCIATTGIENIRDELQNVPHALIHHLKV